MGNTNIVVRCIKTPFLVNKRRLNYFDFLTPPNPKFTIPMKKFQPKLFAMFILLLVLVQPLKLILLQRKNYWKHWKSKRKTNPDGKRKTNPDVLVETSREVAVTILALLLHLRI